MPLGLVMAWDIGWQDMSQIWSCNPNQSEDVSFYLTSDWILTQPYDTFKSTNSTDLLIWNYSSSVEIWRHWIISGCTWWNRSSLVAKGDNPNRVLAIINTWDCSFNIPTDPNYISRKISHPTAIDAQIHFIISYKTLSSTVISNHPKENKLQSRLYYKYGIWEKWMCYPNWPYNVTNTNNCGVEIRYYSNQTYFHTWECRNYRVFRCGDGLVNWRNSNGLVSINYDNDKDENWQYLHSYNEQCDPNDPNHSWWNNNGYICNTSCQLVQLPKCNSDYNGTFYTNTTPYPWINISTPNLCSVWSATSFQGVWPWYGYNWQFSWTCENAAGSIACTANQYRCWDWIVSHKEACDPNDPNQSWWNNNGYTCDNSCHLIQLPKCNSTYSWQTQYTNFDSNPWLSSWMNLCTVWTAINFSYSWTPRQFTWDCKLSLWWKQQYVASCSANQTWCGDGEINGDEKCDDW